MIDLPITVAALAWCLSWLLIARERKRLSFLDGGIALLIGAVFLGAMRPTNTWDFPTYWAVAFVAVIAAAIYRRDKENWRDIFEALLALVSIAAVVVYKQLVEVDTLFWLLVGGALVINAFIGVIWFRRGRIDWRLILEGIGLSGVLFSLAYFLFQSFNLWYKQGYSAASLWEGSKTQLNDYLIVHGLFLFLILTWIIWELRQWMARTPISALNRLRKPFFMIVLFFVLILVGVGVLTYSGLQIIPLASLVLVLAGILFLWADLPLEKRAVLFMIGTGTALTVFVEVVVLQGDISRMNTVFKFYLQVWTLFALSSTACLAWIWGEMSQWSSPLRGGWTAVLFLIVFMAALYPVTATPAKISDRMAEDAPHVLDGMSYMPYASYFDIAGPMELSEDYQAILWMQENIKGSLVIVEANTPEYRWGSRFTIYTGLPGVLGWNWHQRQQRGFGGDVSVTERAYAIADFYTTRSIEEAWDFLDEFDVSYVVVGKLEKQYYESVQPCSASPDGSGVYCDMAGRPMGMPEPDVTIQECQPMNEDPGSSDFICPTYGLIKFDEMRDLGLLEVAYSYDSTTIYRVVP
jgi:YYY domain-containing protein